eukprot:COSAG04_NODE_1642_length_6070_cov_9.329928_1_plen_87_part_10
MLAPKSRVHIARHSASVNDSSRKCCDARPNCRHVAQNRQRQVWAVGQAAAGTWYRDDGGRGEVLHHPEQQLARQVAELQQLLAARAG